MRQLFFPNISMPFKYRSCSKELQRERLCSKKFFLEDNLLLSLPTFAVVLVVLPPQISLFDLFLVDSSRIRSLSPPDSLGSSLVSRISGMESLLSILLANETSEVKTFCLLPGERSLYLDPCFEILCFPKLLRGKSEDTFSVSEVSAEGGVVLFSALAEEIIFDPLVPTNAMDIMLSSSRFESSDSDKMLTSTLCETVLDSVVYVAQRPRPSSCIS